MLQSEIQEGLSSALILVANAHGVSVKSLDQSIDIERCKDPAHGEYASNIALKYAKLFNMNPRQLADELVVRVPLMTSVAGMEVAGPGFINIRLARNSITSVLRRIVEQGDKFGCLRPKKPARVLIEFVSANPTGPLHVGHGRGAAYGDSLANLLEANGHRVEKEYYVNDAGRQMDILALSVYWRYLELCGVARPLPKGLYQGDYVTAIARSLHQQEGVSLIHNQEEWLPDEPEVDREEEIDAALRDKWIDSAIAALRSALGEEDYRKVFARALNNGLADIRTDLEAFGVQFNRWYPEHELFTSGKVKKTLEKLAASGCLYQKDGATWFNAKRFGDEKDRVVRRENGVTTYFASDIAYHLDKYERGYDYMIDVFGADHHGYLARVRAALTALELDPSRLIVALVQFAVLYRNGAKMQMSTRSGEFVTLNALAQEVGSDAARFFYLMRKPEQHLDFDLDLAVSNSKDNPFYYVQYAHARTCRMLEKAAENGATFLPQAALDYRNSLHQPEETTLINVLRRYPDVVLSAGRGLAPHQVIHYLRDLATAWHQFYDAGYKVIHEQQELREARLLLTWCVGQVLRNGLRIVGVQARERM